MILFAGSDALVVPPPYRGLSITFGHIVTAVGMEALPYNSSYI